MTHRACSSEGQNGIPGQNISSWGRKSALKICPEADTIRPKMPFRPLDKQAHVEYLFLKFLKYDSVIPKLSSLISDQNITL